MQDEALFAEKLANDFPAETECKGLSFLIDRGEDNDSATSAKLAQVKLQRYWSLRTDYRPHLTSQEAELRLSGDRLLLGIEADSGNIDRSAEFIIQSACDMSKKGGNGAYW
jgi:hypothetical protein